MKRFFSFILIGLLLLSPAVSHAQGLIVCGTGSSQGFNNPCTFADFLKLANRINDFLLVTVMIPLATFAFGMAGVYYIWGGYDPGKLGMAKTIFWSTFQGVALAVAAWVIVNSILTLLGVDKAFNLLG